MTAIDTTLTTSGNSAAVRLPRELLKMSGLHSKSRVRLEAKQGKIIISKSSSPRQGWDARIKALLETEGDPTEEFHDMDLAKNDNLDSLPWDGPTFEQWQKTHDKLS